MRNIQKVQIHTEYIKLDQLLKWAGIVDSGADAKSLISQGVVKVNNQLIFQRGKKIYPGDEVMIEMEDKIQLVVEK